MMMPMLLTAVLALDVYLAVAASGYPTASDVLLEAFGQGLYDGARGSAHRKTSLRSEVSTLLTSNGYLYYNFYNSDTCGGDVTYNAGIAANTCFTNQSYTPPDSYYYSFFDYDFSSFQVIDLAESCEGTKVAFYYDNNCQQLKSSKTLAASKFGSCNLYHNQTVSLLKSFQGHCALNSTVPAPAQSYVNSVYNQTNCTGMAYQYQAYVSGNCYGVLSTNTSYNYQCNAASISSTTAAAASSVSVAFDTFPRSLTCAPQTLENSMTIEGGCTNSRFVSEPLPVATVSTLVTCTPAATSDTSASKHTKLSPSAAAGILGGVALVVCVLVAFIAYFILGKLYPRPLTAATTVTTPQGARESEMSSTSVSVSHSHAGRQSSNVSEVSNPMAKHG